MHLTHADFSRSTVLRISLKRGLARQVLSEAEPESSDFPALFALAAGLRPNPKGLDRMAARRISPRRLGWRSRRYEPRAILGPVERHHPVSPNLFCLDPPFSSRDASSHVSSLEG